MKIVITYLLILSSFIIKANTYYVAINGNDTDVGNELHPWRTIQKAANILIAGDTVLIKAGTYNERIIVQNSGTLNNYIVFSNYQNDTVIIDGNGISWGNAWNGLFDISNKNYIQIMGLKITNADYGGLWIEGADHIIIDRNYTYNTVSSGIGVWDSSNITVSNNEIELACNDGEQECITIANSSNCTVFGNNVHDNGAGTNGGEGIDAKAGSHDINIYQNEVHHLNNRLGIYADAWDMHTYNINIYQNTIHHCSETGLAIASENGGLIENINIYNNIIYFNQYGGIELGAWSDAGFTGAKPIEHIKIINNTCYKNGSYNNGWGYGINIDNPNAKDVIIRNNLCSENSAQISIQQIDSGGIVDHNLFFGNNNATGTLYGNNSINGNPLFIDAVSYDFHLSANSPAIDNGTSNDAPSNDFEGNNRPLGTGFDIGAYEYNLSLNILENSNSDKYIRIYPNPVSDKLNIIIDNDAYDKYTVQIINISGQLVMEKFINNDTNNIKVINLGELKSGLYLLNIIIDGKLITSTKIILE